MPRQGEEDVPKRLVPVGVSLEQWWEPVQEDRAPSDTAWNRVLNWIHCVSVSTMTPKWAPDSEVEFEATGREEVKTTLLYYS